MIKMDHAVAQWLKLLRPDDLLILTADHGVDPTAPHRPHPGVRAIGGCVQPDAGRRHDGLFADVGASVLRWIASRDALNLPQGRRSLGRAIQPEGRSVGVMTRRSRVRTPPRYRGRPGDGP